MTFWNNLGDSPERTLEIGRIMAECFREEYERRKDISYLREQCGGLRARAKILEAHYQKLNDEADRLCFVDRMGNCARKIQEAEEFLTPPNLSPEILPMVFTALGFVYTEVTGIENSFRLESIID
jgi:hypothetical protein